jgi:drug/metabolite transporter (DMT)-like permease
VQRSGAQPALVWVALVTVYVLWGSTYFGIRVAVETMPPFLMSGVRFILAGTALLAWRLPLARRAGLTLTAAQWRRALVIGAALLLGGNGAVAWAEQTVPSGITALTVASVPMWMALIDRIFYGRRLSLAAIVGLIVGFAGVALLAGSPGGGSVSPIGTAVLIAGSLSWAAGSLYSRTARMPEDSLLATGMEMAAGGACLCLASFAAGEPAHLHAAAISSASWIAFGYLVVFGAIVGFSAYLWVIRAAPTSLVSTYAYVNPLVAVFLGWAFLHEDVSVRIAIAGAIILSAVALIVSAPANVTRQPSECVRP